MESIYNKVYYSECANDGIYILGNYYQAKDIVSVLHKKYPRKEIIGVDNIKSKIMHKYAIEAACWYLERDYVPWNKVQELWEENYDTLLCYAFELMMEGDTDSIFYGSKLQYAISQNCISVEGEAWNAAIVICNYLKNAPGKSTVEAFAEEYIKRGEKTVDLKEWMNRLEGNFSIDLSSLDIENKVFLPKCLCSYNKVDRMHTRHILILADEKEATKIANLINRKCRNYEPKRKYPLYDKDLIKNVTLMQGSTTIKHILEEKGCFDDLNGKWPSKSDFINACERYIKKGYDLSIIFKEIVENSAFHDIYDGIIYGDYAKYGIPYAFGWNYCTVIVGHLSSSEKREIEDDIKYYLERCVKNHPEISNWDLFCDLDILIKSLKTGSYDPIFESSETYPFMDLRYMYESLIGLEGLVDDILY